MRQLEDDQQNETSWTARSRTGMNTLPEGFTEEILGADTDFSVASPGEALWIHGLAGALVVYPIARSDWGTQKFSNAENRNNAGFVLPKRTSTNTSSRVRFKKSRGVCSLSGATTEP